MAIHPVATERAANQEAVRQQGIATAAANERRKVDAIAYDKAVAEQKTQLKEMQNAKR